MKDFEIRQIAEKYKLNKMLTNKEDIKNFYSFVREVERKTIEECDTRALFNTHQVYKTPP